MWKKKIAAAVLISALSFQLAACGLQSAGSDGSAGTTLTIMGKTTDLEKSYITRVFELYESATGNKLKVIEIEDSEFEEAAGKRFDKGDIPDLFLHFNNTALEKYDISANFLYMNDEEWVGDLTEAAKAYCQDSEGNILGLPFWESSVSGCYYNKTLLDGLGLKPATTQTEFNALCQALKDIGYTPVCWPGDGCTWMYQFGLDPVFADEPSLLEGLNGNRIRYADIPAVADMVQWVADAAGKGWFGSDYLNTDWYDISTVMGSGEAVMVFVWDTWFSTDFAEGQRYTKDDFALMPVFMGTAEKGTYEGGNLNMMMLNKNSENLEAARDFLAFCASPDNYNAAFDGVFTVNCFKGQTTNLLSPMVAAAEASISACQRTSTAEPKIVGYSATDVDAAFRQLFQGRTDVAGCIRLMDEYRVAAAKTLGAEGF